MTFIGKLLQLFHKSKVQIVYVRGQYSVHCQEYSRDTGASSYYHYTKPGFIITKDNRTISADDVLVSTENAHQVIPGVTGEYHNSYPEQGVRNREYILHISEKACPLKVKYTSGSGESHKDSEFWSSDHKEYWVIYLRERRNTNHNNCC